MGGGLIFGFLLDSPEGWGDFWGSCFWEVCSLQIPAPPCRQVPNLMQNEDMERIMSSVAPKVKALGKPETRETILSHFVYLCRENMHTVLVMSPTQAEPGRSWLQAMLRFSCGPVMLGEGVEAESENFGRRPVQFITNLQTNMFSFLCKHIPPSCDPHTKKKKNEGSIFRITWSPMDLVGIV